MVSALDAKQAIADGLHKILALVLNKFGSVLDPWVAARLTVTIAL
jgi:CDP-glycerol glycerophosphotransferase (TagB/SpsB family)